MGEIVDVTTIKDRRAYYLARVDFLNNLLAGTLSPKQRREAEFELTSASVKSNIGDKPCP